MEEKILNSCETLFMRYGIKSITMDDVAREIGISKKTLYQYFTDKNELVEKVLENHLNRSSVECALAFEANTNPIDHMLSINKQRSAAMRDFHPTLMYDLKKYYPVSWHKLEEYKHSFIYGQIVENIKLGVEMGLFRADLQTDIAARFYVHLIDAITIDGSGRLNNEYTFRDLHLALIDYHIRAIATPKGIEYFEEKMKEQIK